MTIERQAAPHENKEREETLPTEQPTDREVERSLRPQKLTDYIGQEKLKENLGIFIGAAKKRHDPIEHVLLYGPPGLGKTTLAHIIAREMNVSIHSTSGPAIEKVGDLGAILTNLQPGDILFIDEIHRINKLVEEALYPALEDFKLDIVIGQGPSARTIQLDLPRFTLIGATTRAGILTNALRDRFGFTSKLEFYEPEHIRKILERSATILKTNITNDGAEQLAGSSRRTPRIANRLLKRARDVAEVRNRPLIDRNVVRETLDMLEIDERGLGPIDRLILKTIIEKFNGGPVGVQTIAATTAEEIETVEDVYEPFLIQMGFLQRTSRGRQVTNGAYAHLDLTPPARQKQILS